MNDIYVSDACAMISVLSNEKGADKVVGFYGKASSGDIKLVMNKLNLLEVYYNLLRVYGNERTKSFLTEIKQSPIVINHYFSDEVFLEAGRLKALYHISLANSIALAQTVISDGALITSDHHEFDIVERNENIKFIWIR